MKNDKISLVLSILALVGVIILFIAQSSGKKTSGQTTVSTDSVSRIVYVNMDSVLEKYDLYNALSLQLMQKQQDLQNQLQSKMMSLQNRAYKLDQQYSQHLITTQTYQEKMQKLSNEQAQIQQWQQDKTLELNEDQLQLTQRVFDSIMSVVNYLNADKKYDLVINNAVGGTLLYGNPDWDITPQVVELLNERAKDTVFALDSTATK